MKRFCLNTSISDQSTTNVVRKQGENILRTFHPAKTTHDTLRPGLSTSSTDPNRLLVVDRDLLASFQKRLQVCFLCLVVNLKLL